MTDHTLEHARLVNAVLSAAALCVGSNDPTQLVLDPMGRRYARTEVILDDVTAAFGVSRDAAREALESALLDGLLDVSESGTAHIAVRPALL